MALFVNHYSFVLVFAAAGIALAFFLFRDGIEPRDLLALGALAFGFVFSFSTFSAGESTITDVRAFEMALDSERPVLLELQSPYCLGCAAAKPVVDGIESRHPGLQVVRVNIQDEVGAQLADRYQSRVTPTFLFFDANGVEQMRTFGAVDPEQVSRLLED